MIRCKLIEQVQADALDAVARVDRAVTGEVLGIGRAASCKIYLPDARVRLEHAQIRRAEDGCLYLDAQGPVQVDGRNQATVRLADGQQIVIGPYEFLVMGLKDGAGIEAAALTLAFALRDAGAGAEAASRRLAAGPAESWITRRRLSWLAAFAVLALCALLPAWHAHQPGPSIGPDGRVLASAVPLPGASAPAHPFDTAQPLESARHLALRATHWVLSRSTRLDTFWNPGPIASAHQAIASECRVCHDKPFERVADANCTACHKTVGAHIPDARMDRLVFQEQRCATCHKDHQGLAGMRTVDALGCVQCHADVRRHAPTTALGNISDFARDHPPFRLTVHAGGIGGGVQRVEQTRALKADPGYAFPHDLHLAKAGIKSPDGPAATGGRVVLECASCHTLDAASVRYEPVRMERHCQGCHRLSVDPQAPQRQVPHGKPEAVRTAVREVFAALAVERYPVSLVTVDTLLQRPQAEAPVVQTFGATEWVRAQTERRMLDMFEGRSGECRTCHQVQRAGPARARVPEWSVAPVATLRHWLPHSSFSHAQHKNADCGTCHQAAAQSASSADILLPDLPVCQSCHAGARAAAPKVASPCESCHGFHARPQHPAFAQGAPAASSRP